MSSADESDFEADDNLKESEKSDESNEENSESESDSDQPKKRKAKKSGSDSDDVGTKNKRRKRIKKVASSDEDGEGGDKKKSRKNIRKMLRTDKLDVSTKEAGKMEKERKQRIEERQNMYNQFYDERPEEAKEITKLVLDFDEDTKKSLLQVKINHKQKSPKISNKTSISFLFIFYKYSLKF